MLAFSNDYYGFIFRATQSVELFCAYVLNDLSPRSQHKIQCFILAKAMIYLISSYNRFFFMNTTIIMTRLNTKTPITTSMPVVSPVLGDSEFAFF